MTSAELTKHQAEARHQFTVHGFPSLASRRGVADVQGKIAQEEASGSKARSHSARPVRFSELVQYD